MHFLSHDRPRLPHGQPLLIHPISGISLGATPAIFVLPHAEGWKLSCHICKASNRAAFYSVVLPSWLQVSEFFRDYVEDPEEALGKTFGWKPEAMEEPKSRGPAHEISLEDLGL